MRKIMIWFFLSCKRYLKQPAFLAILLFLPVMAFGAAKLQQDGAQKIRIAVCAEEQGDDEKEAEENPGTDTALELLLVRKLTGTDATDEDEPDYRVEALPQSDGMFEFYLCTGEEQVKAEVASRRAECGYVISANLREQLDSGHFKRVIRVYSAPSTVTASLSTETVFAALMELYDRELLKAYVASGEAFAGVGEPGSEARSEAVWQVGALYDQWKENGSTFDFRYVYGSDVLETGAAGTTFLFPIRGIVAVSLFAVGLYSAVMLGMDEKKGLFKSLDYGISRYARLAVFLAPVALTAISGLLSLQAAGLAGEAAGGVTVGFTGGVAQGVGIFREVTAMMLYGILVSTFALILKKLCPTPQVLCCLVPFFIVGSLVFCPVFIDAGRIFPEIESVGKLFLPYYYLRWFG